MSDPTRTAPFRMKATWWLGNRNYLIFMLRELSPVFMALFLIRLVGVFREALRGPDGYAIALAGFSAPGMFWFSVVALAFSILHAVTWFQAATTVLPVKIMGRPFPPKTPPPALVFAGNLGMMMAIAVGLVAVLVMA